MYDSKLQSADTDELFKAILCLKTEEECYRFFEDLCTIVEIKSLTQRYGVARLLNGGKTFTEVCKLSGASSATVTRVKRCLDYGADGYNLVLKRLKEEAE